MENVTILMYLKGRLNSKGERQIYLRITVDGKRKEKSLNRSVKSCNWNASKQRVKGSSESVRVLNEYLNSEINKVYSNRQELIHSKVKVTVESLMNKYKGVGERKHMLIEIFKNENKKNKNLLTTGTMKKYISLLNHVKEFLKFQYKVSDMNIKEVDFQFVSSFDYYLRTEKSVANNTTVKYVTTLKKIVKTALNNSWITKDPFLNYKVKKEKVETRYLTMDEIQTIYSKEITIPRLEMVRDVFIFCCYTGLAYVDALKLESDNIVMGMDKNLWIAINRQKTNTPSNIPILPIAQTIIDKYKNHPVALNSGKLLPVPSNQKMNAYLKEIGDICGIKKLLTSHLARHSFGCSVTLSNGVPIETISKMMGHSNLNITSHYAKVLKSKISTDMAALRARLAEPKKNSTDDVIDYKKSKAI